MCQFGPALWDSKAIDHETALSGMFMDLQPFLRFWPNVRLFLPTDTFRVALTVVAVTVPIATSESSIHFKFASTFGTSIHRLPIRFELLHRIDCLCGFSTYHH